MALHFPLVVEEKKAGAAERGEGMKAVMLSVQPPHTTNIFNGTKSIEWRTKPIPPGKQYLYETKNGGGVGKVVGECSIWRIHRYENVSLIPEGHIDAGCVPYEFLAKYSKGKPLYAHFIVNANRYDKPKALSEFVVVGDCDCLNCKQCAWFDKGNGFNIEDDCNLAYENVQRKEPLKPLFRPPQSWCHVEELK